MHPLCVRWLYLNNQKGNYMSSKKVMLGKGSVVPHVMVDATSPLFLPKNKNLIEMIGHAVVYRSKTGQLIIAKGYALPKGVGRSLRAAVLGFEYKCAWRVGGASDHFAPRMFNYPQDSSALRARMKKKQTRHVATSTRPATQV